MNCWPVCREERAPQDPCGNDPAFSGNPASPKEDRIPRRVDDYSA